MTSWLNEGISPHFSDTDDLYSCERCLKSMYGISDISIGFPILDYKNIGIELYFQTGIPGVDYCVLYTCHTLSLLGVIHVITSVIDTIIGCLFDDLI